MADFLMPSLGSDMEAGTLIEWEKQPGDSVRRGDIIAVVETQKGAIEVEVFEDGVLESQLVEIGRPVPVGTPLARIVSPGEVVSTRDAVSPVDTNSLETGTGTETETETGTETGTAGPDRSQGHPDIPAPAISVSTRPARKPHTDDRQVGVREKITPAARRLAAEAGVSTTGIRGSGPDGSIVLDDVRVLVDAHKEDAHKEPVSASPMSAMRSAIAASMTHSKREIPHYYLAHSVDMTVLLRWLQQTNEERDPEQRVLPGAVLLKAVATAAVKYPEFNGFYRDESFQPAATVNAGMAINLRGGGLVAPAIHHVEQLNVDEIMQRMRDLVERVRKGRFRAAELADPTLTVSSLGERGVDSLYGVIYPPQVAIVGFGTPVLRPWVDAAGAIEARTVMEMTLAADHRVSDGHRGALFLRHIERQLVNPGKA